MTTRNGKKISVLSPSASPSHVFDDPSALSEPGGIGLLLRHRNRQQQMDRRAERAGDLLVQCNGSFALSRFEFRQVALGDASGRRQLGLRHIAPFAQDADGILSGRQPVDHSLGQHDLVARRQRRTRPPHDSGRAFVLANARRESLVLTLWKDGQLLAAHGLDELNFGHDGLSIINFAAMSDGSDDDGIALDVEHDAPIADAQPCPATPFEPLYVALTGPREGRELDIDPSAHVGGKLEPLPGRRGAEGDLHAGNIAKCNIAVKIDIANCNIGRRP